MYRVLFSDPIGKKFHFEMTKQTSSAYPNYPPPPKGIAQKCYKKYVYPISVCPKLLNFQQLLKHTLRVFSWGAKSTSGVTPRHFWALQFFPTKITSLAGCIIYHKLMFDLWSHFCQCSWEIGSVSAERVGWGRGRFTQRMMAVSGLAVESLGWYN